MDAKQNALEVLRFGRPERVVGFMPSHGVCYFGANHEGFDAPRAENSVAVGGKWTDIWGVEWEKEYEGIMGFPKGHPLGDLPQALKTYPWPDPNDERLCGQIYEQAAKADRKATFLSGSHRCTLFENANKSIGMEDIMCYFYTEPGALREVLHRVMDFQLGMARHYLKVGVDVVSMGDDLGTQSGLLISPQIVQEFLVPEYRRLFDLYKQNNVIINFHSCGHITPLLEVFIDLGVDCLNPIQASANDLAEVRRITQGRMALQGGVSSGLIVSGPADAIRREVKRCLWLLGRNGGYFCSPDQYMPWPAENYDVYAKALEEFGVYPLQEA